MTRWWRRALAGSAALAGALAPLAGSPYRGAAPDAGHVATRATTRATIDVAELARVVADQADHISALELAAWIRDRRPGLRVIDLRSAAEFAAYHIPGAEHVPLDQLTSARFAAGDTLALVSETGVHAAQAWVFLRALGHRRVVFLQSGIHEWLDDVLHPALPAGAPAEAEATFARTAELSRWFGGTPRRLAEPAPDAPVHKVRRGC